MRKRTLLIVSSTVVVLVIITLGIGLLAQTPESTTQSSPLEELPSEETPPDLLVVPEAPLGTLAIILAFFFALIIIQMKHKPKLQ